MPDRRALLLAVAAAALGAPALALADPAPVKPVLYDVGDGQLTLHMVDMSPRFLAFWAAAKDEADPDKRYALWKSMYGFAAVPPGPQGEAMARRLLEAGWSQYPSAIETIKRGARSMRPDALETARKVAAVLGANQPMTIKVVAYVGAFDNNAFSFRGEDKTPVVCVPLEMSVDRREVVFPHEMTHAVHMEIGHLSGGWERTIGTTIVEEGLAMEVSRVVSPGRDFRAYIEGRPGWFDEAEAKKAAILEGLLPVLDKKDSDTVFKFTIGKGNTGIEREAYFAGWTIMEHLHAHGMGWPQIARVPEDKMPAFVAKAIGEVLHKNG